MVTPTIYAWPVHLLLVALPFAFALKLTSLPAKYRGLPRALWNMYHGIIIEDIQKATKDFYKEPVYGFWESTKNYQDTGEHIGFVSLSGEEAVPSDENADEEEDGGSDDEADEELDEAYHGGEMSPSARRVPTASSPLPRLEIA